MIVDRCIRIFFMFYSMKKTLFSSIVLGLSFFSNAKEKVDATEFKSFEESFYKIQIQSDKTLLIVTHDETNQEKRRQKKDQTHDSNFTAQYKTRSEYKEAMRGYLESGSVVKNKLLFRGDSRFPWKVWQSGGFLPKAKESHEFSVLLHQWSPSSGQNVVSTFEEKNAGLRYATAWGLLDQLYIPKLDQFHVDQSDKTWSFNHGYIYAVWVPEGVSLEKHTEQYDEFSIAKMYQKRYEWEKEIAVLGGLEKENILACREVEKQDPESVLSDNIYTETMYISKNLIDNLQEYSEKDHTDLKKILQDMVDIEEKDLAETLSHLKEQIRK